MQLRECRSWHYQLQGEVDPSIPADLFVIDVDADPRPIKAQGDRVVLAYLSIGEAEDYRAYWPLPDAKDVVLHENPEWEGNYAVRFWRSSWQATITGIAKTALARGFDGVYLDKADVVDDMVERYGDREGTGQQLVDRMRDFIARLRFDLGSKAVIVMQNALYQLENPEVVSAIDGVGVEDLVYGEDETGRPNNPDSVARKMRLLLDYGGPVFQVEYLPSDGRAYYTRSNGMGWPLTIESPDRELNGRTTRRFKGDA